MKVRHGFVSNSSSSSFLCEVCGETQSGWDLCLEEAEMVSCQNGHTFCESHMEDVDFDSKSLEEKKELLLADKWFAKKAKEEGADIEDLYEEWQSNARYEMPSAMCLFCQLDQVSDAHLILHLLKVLGSSREQVIEQIKEQYVTYEDFTQAMKS